MDNLMIRQFSQTTSANDTSPTNINILVQVPRSTLPRKDQAYLKHDLDDPVD